ncbi:MAG: hypothetical protein VX478_04070, partial [Chloroflexota bacterium]|nr:hypothetical protein [Chloroflexota bacterium]
KAKRCDDIKFPDENQRPNLDQGRNVPVAHQYENRINDSNRRGGDGQNQGGDGQNQGLPPGITMEQFNDVFGGGQPRMVVKERVDQCVGDGNPMNECLRDVKNNMREEFKSHENFDHNKYSDRKELDELSTSAVRQNTGNPQGGDGQTMHTNQFGGRGDGVGKRGGQEFNQCMTDNTSTGPQYNSDGTFASSPSHGDAADNCMGQASNTMRDSYGNKDMGHHAGFPQNPQSSMTTQQ